MSDIDPNILVLNERIGELEANGLANRVAILRLASNVANLEAERDALREAVDEVTEYAKRHEAERDALEAKLALAVALLGQWRLASAGHVSLRSVIDKHDATLAELTGDTP
jgi:predicted  nucleic acid-binding Zn-ribbon protein